jgi:hypothetical protein
MNAIKTFSQYEKLFAEGRKQAPGLMMHLQMKGGIRYWANNACMIRMDEKTGTASAIAKR